MQQILSAPRSGGSAASVSSSIMSWAMEDMGLIGTPATEEETAVMTPGSQYCTGQTFRQGDCKDENDLNNSRFVRL
jgi:hypothetical protein